MIGKSPCATAKITVHDDAVRRSDKLPALLNKRIRFMAKSTLAILQNTIIACERCERLVAWRQQVARDKRAAFRDQDYWGKPIPGFGDPAARLLVCGLAPAAHGGNRTGRVFTGDRSGDWLFAALFRAGFANQPTSTHRDDGLKLQDCYITACVRCAPPDNKPTTEERDNCLGYFTDELRLLKKVRVIVCLGAFAWHTVGLTLRVRKTHHAERDVYSKKHRFGHGAEMTCGPYVLVGSYHPSQQNTFTGRLTEAMLDAVFSQAKSHLAPR
jgi:uracil-DNA glycosylase family 4